MGMVADLINNALRGHECAADYTLEARGALAKTAARSP